MKKRFFIHSDISKKIIALLFISFLVSFQFFLAFFVFLSVLFYFFRIPTIDEGRMRSSDDSILLAPVSGRTKVKVSGGKARVTIKVGYLSGFGVSMPFEGEVISYIETNENKNLFNFFPVRKSKIIVVLKSKLFGETKFVLMRTGFIFRPRIWVRSGDKGLVGAYIGYIPFGGEVVIEVEDTVNLLINEKDRVSALTTLIASHRIKK